MFPCEHSEFCDDCKSSARLERECYETVKASNDSYEKFIFIDLLEWAKSHNLESEYLSFIEMTRQMTGRQDG